MFSNFQCTSFTFLLLISKYFNLFDASINWIVLLISLSYCSLLAYRNITDYCILILDSVISLNSCIRSSRFYVCVCGPQAI